MPVPAPRPESRPHQRVRSPALRKRLTELLGRVKVADLARPHAVVHHDPGTHATVVIGPFPTALDALLAATATERADRAAAGGLEVGAWEIVRIYAPLG